MKRAVVTRVVPVALCATSMIVLCASPGSATPAAKLSAKCEKAVTKLVTALAKDPSGRDDKAYGKYVAACPKGPQVEIRGLAGSSTTVSTESGGKKSGVKGVSSSNRSLVFLGPQKETEIDGVATTAVAQTVVGIGKSTVCVTWRNDSQTCTLVIVPKAITTKPYKDGDQSYGLITGIGSTPDSGVEVTEVTSTDQAVVVTFGNSGANVVGPGTTTVCVKFATAAGGCQTWRVASS